MSRKATDLITRWSEVCRLHLHPIVLTRGPATRVISRDGMTCPAIPVRWLDEYPAYEGQLVFISRLHEFEDGGVTLAKWQQEGVEVVATTWKFGVEGRMTAAVGWVMAWCYHTLRELVGDCAHCSQPAMHYGYRLSG